MKQSVVTLRPPRLASIDPRPVAWVACCTAAPGSTESALTRSTRPAPWVVAAVPGIGRAEDLIARFTWSGV